MTILCWLLGHVPDPDLHGGRLRMLFEKLVDTPVRGVVYERALPAGEDDRARRRRALAHPRRDHRPGADAEAAVHRVGELIAMPGYEQEGAQRAGHIPGAASVPWAQAVREDGTFKSADELSELYGAKGVTNGEPIIAYCRIGERSAHTWFVLHELLGKDGRQELRRLVDRVGQHGQRPDREVARRRRRWQRTVLRGCGRSLPR